MGTPTHIWMCWGATDGTADNTGTGAMCVLVPAQANPAEKIRCEVKPHNGKTTVFVNGVPKFPMAFTSYYPEQYRYRQMAEQGIHTYLLILTMTDKWLGGDMPVKWNTPGLWRGPDEVDLATVEENLKKIVDMDPEALIVIRVFCDSPIWWDLLHPEETNTQGKLGGQGRRQSFSSLVWRKDTAEALKKLVRGVSASKYGNRVIGYMPTAGDTEEMSKHIDSGVCTQKRFREWLFARYGKDNGEIERLFGNKIEEIAFPSPAERSKADCGNFLDPQKSRLVIELRQFHSDEIVDSGLAFCKAVKEASDGRLITGTFYGYTQLWPDTGHLALRRMLDSEHIDFVTTAGGGGASENDSIIKAGKIMYSEIDTKTSLVQWISKLRPDIDPHGKYNEERWFGPPTIAISLQNLKSTFARSFVKGSANWWFDLWGGWYDNEAILKMFGQMRIAAEESISRPRGSVSQVAVFVDENSFRYLPYGVSDRNKNNKFLWIRAQVGAAGYIGAPNDFYLFDDLKDLDLSRFRMLVFVNAFALSEEQRAMIRERCMNDKRLLVWVYAPGLIKDNLSADNISSLLGMKVRMEATHPKAQISVKFPGETKVYSYEGAEVSPFFHVVEGADAEVGHTAEGRVVVAEKNGADYRNIFVSLPPLPWVLLQKYAKQAGVHLYMEGGGGCIANESYLALPLSASGTGIRTLKLPKKAALKELVAVEPGQTNLNAGLSFEKNDTFDIPCTNGMTRIFQILP